MFKYYSNSNPLQTMLCLYQHACVHINLCILIEKKAVYAFISVVIKPEALFYLCLHNSTPATFRTSLDVYVYNTFYPLHKLLSLNKGNQIIVLTPNSSSLSNFLTVVASGIDSFPRWSFYIDEGCHPLTNWFDTIWCDECLGVCYQDTI